MYQNRNSGAGRGERPLLSMAYVCRGQQCARNTDPRPVVVESWVPYHVGAIRGRAPAAVRRAEDAEGLGAG